MAPHHVSPGKHIAPTRAPNLELRLVDDDVFPHAALADYSATPTIPLALDHFRLIHVVFPNMLSPVLDVDVVNMQPLRAT